MKIVRFDQIKWDYEELGNFYHGYHDDLPANESADIFFAKLDPLQRLHTHFHDRPTKDGYISFHFFNGAHIKIILPDDEDQIINTIESFHVTFDHLEKHGIENLSDTELVFEVIAAPPYVEGEETHISK